MSMVGRLSFKKPQSASGGFRLAKAPLPKSSVVNTIEEAEKVIVRAQEQIEHVKRFADGRQEDFDRVREELSSVRFFDPMHIVNITQTSAHAEAAYLAQSFSERHSSEDIVALRDAANDFCTEKIEEIKNAL